MTMRPIYAYPLAVLFGAVGYAGIIRIHPTTSAALPLPSRIERPCLPVGERGAVIIIHGQSNAGNHGLGAYKSRQMVDNFDPVSGRCFEAVEPLLGPGGGGASFATRLGDILIESKRYDRVIVTSIARGTTSIADLSSTYADRIDNLITKLKAAQLMPTVFLFEHGEEDGSLTTTAEQYASSLQTLVKRFRDAGMSAPFYVSLTSKCGLGSARNSKAVRSGQSLAVSKDLDIRPGPDTDDIGEDGRNPSDHCHMSETGTLANAALWASFIP